jgi:hypothetical protein
MSVFTPGRDERPEISRCLSLEKLTQTRTAGKKSREFDEICSAWRKVDWNTQGFCIGGSPLVACWSLRGEHQHP